MDRTIHNYGLLKPFIKEPWREFTLTEIKKITKKTSHHYVFEGLKRFTKLNIITEKKRGNTNIYSINPENQDLHYLAGAEAFLKEQRKNIPYKNLKQLKIKHPFYTLIIGGSYAENKQTPASDLDIGIIIPNSESKKLYQVALKAGELMMPEIHGYVFTVEEFYQMLINSEFNYGRELARKHIIYYGAEQYYSILFKAMKHGFKG